MRRKRITIDGPACYHVMNRVHARAFLFDAESSEEFCRIMRKVEAFTGVQVLTHCVMTNHFHLLLKVPKRKELSDASLFARYKKLAAPATYNQLKQQYDAHVRVGHHDGMKHICARLQARMFDLSMFMKELKQRFTQWYNTRNQMQGRGNFWNDRFKSVLIEGRGYTIATVAAYIDLNPVRAGMVSDPTDHRWCGYAAASIGNPLAMEGLREVVREFFRRMKTILSDEEVLAIYHILLFGKPGKRPGTMRPEDVEEVFSSKGMVPPWEMAQHQLRWVSRGLVIGGKLFVASVAQTWNDVLNLKNKLSDQEKPNEAGWFVMQYPDQPPS